MIYHRSVLLFLFLSFTTSIFAVRGVANLPNAYLFIGILVPAAVISYFSSRKRISFTRKFDLLDIMPIVFVAVWFYGISVGFYRGNEPGYILRNFSGLIVYSLFYAMLVSRCKVAMIIDLVLLAGKITLVISLLSYVVVKFAGVTLRDTLVEVMLFNNLITGGDDGAGTRLLYVGQLLIFPLFCFHGFRLLSGLGENTTRQIFSSIVVVVLVAFVVFVVARSKAFYLSFGIYTVWIVICVYGKKYRFLLGVLSCLLALIFLTLSPSILALFSDAYQSIFGGNWRGNTVRLSGIEYMLDDLTLLGKGFGAEIQGYLRNEDAPYAAEVVYINLIHKIGIVSIVAFALYWYTLNRLNRLTKRYSNSAQIFSLYGLLSFLIYSVGNPLLLSSLAISMHLTVNYCVRVLDYTRGR